MMSFADTIPSRDGSTVMLRNEMLLLALAPAIGGSIAAFDWIGGAVPVPLMRRAQDGEADPLGMACFPLVPFANRIAGGRFLCGNEVRLPSNLAGEPGAIHGHGWQAAWQIERATATSARLTFRHEAGDWPWDYEAWQDFVLQGRSLAIRMGCRNLSARAMPCGLGLHPYFPCAAGTRLQASVDHVLTVDADLLPCERKPATGPYDIADRAICGVGLDNGFGGWDGTARIDWPDRGLSITMTALDAGWLQVYAPAHQGYFAAEPVSHRNAALNTPQSGWKENGITMLATGEHRTLECRFEIFERV